VADANSNESWQNPLPGVPDVESPFFDRLFNQKQAKPGWYEAAVSLRDKGYAIIDFPDEDFDALADEIKSDLEPRYDFDGWRREGRDRGASLRIQDAWKDNPAVRRVAGSPAILELLEYLYGRPAWPCQTLNFPVGTQQHFHTDAVHFSSIPERFMCGVWVALEDIDSENGPLVYYPGSHKLPIFTNEHIGHFADDWLATGQQTYEPMWRELVEAQGLEREQFHARKGQALIWASNLLHGGERHLDLDRTRWSQVSHYYFDDCLYYTPLNSDPGYGRMYLRDMTNIMTGAQIPNRYLGNDVPKDFIHRMRHGVTIHRDVPDDFNSELYLELHPDVAEAGVDAGEHYLTYGQFERRPYKR